MREFGKDVGEDFLVDTVFELEELVYIYLVDEFIESVSTKIDELRRKLDSSAAIPKPKQQRLRTLFDDVTRHTLAPPLWRVKDDTILYSP